MLEKGFSSVAWDYLYAVDNLMDIQLLEITNVHQSIWYFPVLSDTLVVAYQNEMLILLSE